METVEEEGPGECEGGAAGVCAISSVGWMRREEEEEGEVTVEERDCLAMRARTCDIPRVKLRGRCRATSEEAAPFCMRPLLDEPPPLAPPW